MSEETLRQCIKDELLAWFSEHEISTEVIDNLVELAQRFAGLIDY